MRDWQHEKWDELMEVLAEEECLLAEGYEDALIGYTAGINRVAVYEVGKMIQIRMQEDGMSYDEAVECIEFNTIGAYVGEKTPVYVVLDHERTAKVLP
jgi:hypothetical protein